MQIITKHIQWRALMETYQTAKFDRSPNNLSWDIVLTDRWPEPKKKKEKKKKRNKKSKSNRCNRCRSNYTCSKFHPIHGLLLRPFSMSGSLRAPPRLPYLCGVVLSVGQLMYDSIIGFICLVLGMFVSMIGVFWSSVPTQPLLTCCVREMAVP